MHFGRDADAAERAKEQALIDCLEAHADEVDHLYLLGDVFDGYIEYRHLVPKGFVRFQGLLARWTDRGVPVTYLLGNHDPWHQDHFSTELGVRLVADAEETTHFGHRLHLAHGDALASTHRFHDWLRFLLRHPVPVGLYRTLLPANVGLGLARWVSRQVYDPDSETTTAAQLRRRARSLLRHPPLDAVILGHSHVPVLHDEANGAYANTGNWYEQRSFVRLDKAGLHLKRWNGARTQDIESIPL